MTPRGRPVEGDDLHARIDGQLPRKRTEDVEAYLAAHPEEQARFSQYAQQWQALRTVFAAQVGGPIPNRLRVAHLVAQQRRRRRRPLGRIAAAMCLIVLGGIGGWAAHELMGPLSSLPPGAIARMITADAITAHRTYSVEVRHPVEVDADQEAHLVQWLSKRLADNSSCPTSPQPASA
jgi:anti-sigma factor RsiW